MATPGSWLAVTDLYEELRVSCHTKRGSWHVASLPRVLAPLRPDDQVTGCTRLQVTTHPRRWNAVSTGSTIGNGHLRHRFVHASLRFWAAVTCTRRVCLCAAQGDLDPGVARNSYLFPFQAIEEFTFIGWQKLTSTRITTSSKVGCGQRPWQWQLTVTMAARLLGQGP